jgi:hypothetical protein
MQSVSADDKIEVARGSVFERDPNTLIVSTLPSSWAKIAAARSDRARLM